VNPARTTLSGWSISDWPNAWTKGSIQQKCVKVGDEVLTEGSDIAEDKLEACIRRHLGLSEQTS